MEFSISENTKASELLRSDDYIYRGHPKVKPKKKRMPTEKKPKPVMETRVKMKGLTIKEILLSKVRDAVPKGTIVERLMYESKIRTEEDIAKDLDENFIPKLKVFAYGGMTPKAMAKFLSDSDKCPEWFNKFGWFKNQIDKYVDNYKYLSDSERRDMWYKIHESARDMLSALDKNGFYAFMKKHKSKMRVIEEMVIHCYYLAYGKDAKEFVELDPYVRTFIVRHIEKLCESRMSATKFTIEQNETNPELLNVTCVWNGMKYVTVV